MSRRTGARRLALSLLAMASVAAASPPEPAPIAPSPSPQAPAPLPLPPLAAAVPAPPLAQASPRPTVTVKPARPAASLRVGRMATSHPHGHGHSNAGDGAFCGRTLHSPFDGPLMLRTAYRGAAKGAFQFCPQWSSFGPVRGAHRNHWGIDIAAPTGTQVRAATDGTLSYGRDPGGYGLFARLRYQQPRRGKDGTCGGGEEVEIIYAHLVDDNGKLSMSARPVRAGEVIGRVGCTGNAKGMCSPSPESHLHVTVQKTAGARVRLDPATVLGWHVITPREEGKPADWGVCGRPPSTLGRH